MTRTRPKPFVLTTPPDRFDALAEPDARPAADIAELERTSHDWAAAHGTDAAGPLLDRLAELSRSIADRLAERERATGGEPLRFDGCEYRATGRRGIKALLPVDDQRSEDDR